MFSPPLAMAGVKSTHIFKEEQFHDCHDYTSPLRRIDLKDEIPHDEMSWSYDDEFIPHEIIFSASKDSDSSSTSSEEENKLTVFLFELKKDGTPISNFNFSFISLIT